MHDAGPVGRVDRPRQRDHQLRRLADRLRRAGYPVRERAPLQQLKREEGVAVRLADLVDLHDIGMTQSGHRIRFNAEAGQLLQVGMAAVQAHLQGDQAVQRPLPCLVNHPHAAPAYLTDDLVAGWVRTGCSRSPMPDAGWQLQMQDEQFVPQCRPRGAGTSSRYASIRGSSPARKAASKRSQAASTWRIIGRDSVSRSVEPVSSITTSPSGCFPNTTHGHNTT